MIGFLFTLLIAIVPICLAAGGTWWLDRKRRARKGPACLFLSEL